MAVRTIGLKREEMLKELGEGSDRGPGGCAGLCAVCAVRSWQQRLSVGVEQWGPR